MSLTGIHERYRGKIDKPWPTLPVVGGDICNCELLIWISAEVLLKRNDRISHLLSDCRSESYWRHVSYRRLNTQLIGSANQIGHFIVGIHVCKHLHFNSSDFSGD